MCTATYAVEDDGLAVRHLACRQEIDALYVEAERAQWAGRELVSVQPCMAHVLWTIDVAGGLRVNQRRS